MPNTEIRKFGLLLEGKMSTPLSGRYFDVINPSDGGLVAQLADAGTLDGDIAVQGARLAFDHGQWPHLTVGDRGKLLIKVGALIREHAKDLADLESAATGKTLKHTTFIDVPTCAETFEYFGNLSSSLAVEKMSVTAPVLSLTYREPVGVVVGIIPWNYPLIMAAWKMAPALLAGNTVVLKPSEFGSAGVMLLARIISEAGFPKGVINIVSSSRKEAGPELVSHPMVDMVSFTGSSASGEEVMAKASKGVKRLMLELGGKSPNIVFANCDQDAALGGTLSAIFLNGGQMCTAGSRLLIEEGIHDDFVARLVERTKALKIGPADDFQTEFGPLVNCRHRDSVLAWIKKGKAEGATLACGGQIPKGLPLAGAYMEPTIFTHVRNDMSIAQEEIFGPVLSVIKFSSVNEAVQIANDSKYGLAAMVWSKDLAKANTVAKRLRCGTVWINTYGVFLNEAPFGGYKHSGFGRELGKEGLWEYTQLKHTVTDETPGGKSLVTSWF